ncbi:LOW QUALITY PROTEIN: hypothetical protein JCM24511_02464 [Saitozyma sp. JCM 24511]|nr:LOW QUALITY PROTEIN: hypothetical protein JCM24511_02464 [Saitozyma sp. JCM 24511]
MGRPSERHLIIPQGVSGATAWISALRRSTDQLLELDAKSLRALETYLDPSDPVTARLICDHVASVSGEDVELLRAFLQVPRAQDEVLRHLIRNTRPMYDDPISQTATRHNVAFVMERIHSDIVNETIIHWYPDDGNGTVREIIFELLSIDLATGLEWIRDLAETESVEWLGSYCDLLETFPALEEPTNAHWLHLAALVIAQRSPPYLADRAYLLLEKTATMVPWDMRSKRTQAAFAGILTRRTSSERVRENKIRTFAELTRGGQLKMDNSSGDTLRLIFFAHHGLAIIRLARPAHRCPEARELVASVVLATCQLTQRDRGVDRGVSQDTEDRQTPTADDQSQPLDPSERRLLYKSVLKTLNEIIQVNGRQQQPPMISPVLHIADTVSGARAQYKFW